MDISLPAEEEMNRLMTQLVEKGEVSFPPIWDLSIEDSALIFSRVLKRFVDEFPEEGYKPLPIFTKDGQEIQNPSVVTLLADKNGFPELGVVAYRDEGIWIFSGFFEFGVITGVFFATAYQFVSAFRRTDDSITDEQFKEYIVTNILNVLRMAMLRLPKWIELMTDSFQSQMELIWAKNVFEDIKSENMMVGVEIPNPDITAFREKSIRNVTSRMREFLQDETGFDDYILRLKKEKFIYIYRIVQPHWDTMQKLQLAGKNWRRYIQAGDMSDITDDLIENFVNDARPNDIALEHAARRAELYNVGKLTKKNQALREKGIKCSGYSRSKLFQFKKEGEQILEAKKSQSSP